MYPLVSICIPTYNGSQYIEEALNSAINQTYPSLEIVISDDQSSDDTLKIIKQFAKKTNIPIYIYSHIPSGIGANWNHCVKKANGAYIKFLFQDDILNPSCVEEMVKLALEDIKIGLVFSERNILAENKNDQYVEWINTYSNLSIHLKGLERISNGKKLLKKADNILRNPKNKIGEPSIVLLKKEVFTKIGYFDQELVQILDFEFWLRIMKKYKIAFISKKLATFRLHNEQATQKNKNIKDYELFPYILYKNFFFYLNFKVQKELFKKYNPIYLFIKKIIKSVIK